MVTHLTWELWYGRSNPVWKGEGLGVQSFPAAAALSAAPPAADREVINSDKRIRNMGIFLRT